MPVITNAAVMSKHAIERRAKNFIDQSQYLNPEQFEKLKPPQHTTFKAFLIFCTLTTLASAGLLNWYKKEVVKTMVGGDDSIIDVIVEIYNTVNWPDLPNYLKLVKSNELRLINFNNCFNKIIQLFDWNQLQFRYFFDVNNLR